jgi:hypothetical protein
MRGHDEALALFGPHSRRAAFRGCYLRRGCSGGNPPDLGAGMTKLEQVARAISDRLLERHILMDSYVAAECARAAVESLREPDEAMLDAGNGQLDCANERQCWRAMVDAILSEKPE